MTPHEARMWHLLRNRALHGLKFRRQQPIDGYVADFCCFEKRLIIELDGAIHAEAKQREYDKERNEYLSRQGFTVLRFSNNDPEEDVLRRILEVASDPSPLAGEGRGGK